ncbi:hypothetical protein [Spirulina subsalsa]|uniref:hypothetical protein n=1 Tax=Spirulina subsalsa TaxID=54311 RepID=UPI000474C87D|nr:hypothetical protein [Spirulina subsalsa]
MLTNDNQQKSILKRIERVVSILMEEDPLFNENLSYLEIVQDLVKRCQKNLSVEEFNTMSDEELKEYSRGLMTIELLGTIGEAFTPEQRVIFDNAIKRK